MIGDGRYRCPHGRGGAHVADELLPVRRDGQSRPRVSIRLDAPVVQHLLLRGWEGLLGGGRREIGSDRK